MKKDKNLKINLDTNLENLSKYIRDDNEIKLLSDIEITAKAYFILYNDSKPWKMEIIAELKKISEPKNQIDYLRNQNIEYLKYVSDNPYLLAASGYTQKTHQHKAGLDRWIELEISKIELSMVNDKPIKSKNKISYIWENNPDKELPELFELMVNKHKLIAPETNYEQFKAAFTGQPIDDEFKPIKWHQDNATELLYFINRLNFYSNITKPNQNADYKKMTSCFVKPDGKPFKAAWKSLNSHIEINLSDAKQKVIDKIINEF
jgi:hypothetical protein